MENIKKLILIGLFLTIIETLFFGGMIELTNKMYPFSWRGVGWGIYWYYSFWWFV